MQLRCEELLSSSLIQSKKKNCPKTAVVLVGPYKKVSPTLTRWTKVRLFTVYVLKNWHMPLLQALIPSVIPLMVSPRNQNRSCSWRKYCTVLLLVKTISLILNQAARHQKKDVQAEVRESWTSQLVRMIWGMTSRCFLNSRLTENTLHTNTRRWTTNYQVTFRTTSCRGIISCHLSTVRVLLRPVWCSN